ncbi:MAG: type II toxin-antitoxin system PemK/MazF family toxin [Ignavibacteriales bacterium]|nr:type II toxin-antitoxin system PemK/MazF family toxin [Ignavibacteriales bacterium]
MKKGDIVLVPFPYTDLSATKIRPALVLSTELNDVTLAFISTNIKFRTDSDVFLAKNESNKLKFDSLLKLNRLLTLTSDLVEGKIGELTTYELTKVDKALLKVFKIQNLF